MREREREIFTLGTGWEGESHALLEDVNEPPSLHTAMYCALGRP